MDDLSAVSVVKWMLMEGCSGLPASAPPPPPGEARAHARGLTFSPPARSPDGYNPWSQPPREKEEEIEEERQLALEEKRRQQLQLHHQQQQQQQQLKLSSEASAEYTDFHMSIRVLLLGDSGECALGALGVVHHAEQMDRPRASMAMTWTFLLCVMLLWVPRQAWARRAS